jgi:hypothetical protein|tara:strand:+ start:83 stop:283 length:201 start_codon:yes stop_codon:yes gene_type:complete
MKRIATLALLGHISAIKINQRFIEDVDDTAWVEDKNRNLVQNENSGSANKKPVVKTDSKAAGQNMV